MAQSSLGLLQGTVDVLILRTLAWAPMHGYGIARWISDRSDGAFAVEDAALYQALHRLERKGLVESEWGTSEKNHRAKYYSLTPAGRRHLKTEVAELREYMGALFRVLDPA
ncbi:MAG TPA: PadR family transcriptional regulator [Gemmatimonadaceae bacterium]|jgi:transcriptional regulator|nr:PadR family transcriptional regulator [Gemmatimonadaceae bacterium]